MPNRRALGLGGKLSARKGMWLKWLKKGIVRCLMVLKRKWSVCGNHSLKVSEKTLAFGKKIRMILAGISLNACECIVPYAVKGGDTNHSCACQEDGAKNHMN